MWQRGHLTVNHKMEGIKSTLFSPYGLRRRGGDGNGLEWGGREEASPRFNSFKNRVD